MTLLPFKGICWLLYFSYWEHFSKKGTLLFYRALVVVVDNSGTAAAVSYLLGNNVNIYSHNTTETPQTLTQLVFNVMFSLKWHEVLTKGRGYRVLFLGQCFSLQDKEAYLTLNLKGTHALYFRHLLVTEASAPSTIFYPTLFFPLYKMVSFFFIYLRASVFSTSTLPSI